METADEVQELLREAQERGLGQLAHALLVRFRDGCRQALEWQRKAGRALAEEGLETDVLTRGIEGWIGRERLALRARLRRMLDHAASEQGGSP